MAQELKAYNVVATADVNPEVVDSLGCTEFAAYDADEVDAVLAEKDKEIAELKAQVHDYAQGMYVVQARAEKEARHQKYKRCLAMARWCCDMWADIDTPYFRYRKWELRWLELAEKFKPNSTAQQGKGYKMGSKIQIIKNPNGDTRTAPKDVSFEDFARANDMHINDVKSVMRELAARMNESSAKHDYTKKTHEDIFYRDFLATMNDGADFVNGEWYQLHIHEERHHPLSFCHKDINLLDIIEMCVDCTVAGLARSGFVRPMEVSTEILQFALDNTSKLVQSMCNVVETEGSVND